MCYRIVVLGAILPNAFPGWAASAATALTYLFGFGESTIPWIVTIMLLSIGLAITVSPVVYKTIERVEMVLVVIIVAFLVVAIIIATDSSAWTGIVTEAPEGITNFPRYVNEIGIATILGAIAFAGAGGANNLCQSNYVRNKGMGVHIPRIVSPITGEEEARPSTGYSFEINEENMRRWNGWWKVANREQLLTFVVIWSGIQPLWLLVIASSGGGVVMFLYSGMLIWLNRRILPEPIKIKGARLIIVALTFAVFAVLSMYLVYYYVNAAMTGQL